MFEPGFTPTNFLHLSSNLLRKTNTLLTLRPILHSSNRTPGSRNTRLQVLRCILSSICLINLRCDIDWHLFLPLSPFRL